MGRLPEGFDSVGAVVVDGASVLEATDSAPSSILTEASRVAGIKPGRDDLSLSFSLLAALRLIRGDGAAEASSASSALAAAKALLDLPLDLSGLRFPADALGVDDT